MNDIADLHLSRLSVLVADDSLNIRKLVSEMLRSIGVKTVRQASSGIEVFEILKTCPVDLMILDLVMDQLDGIETAKLLRQSPDSPNRTVPIILITGHTERSNIVRARDAGINEVIAKPFSAQVLLDHLRHVLTCEREWIVTPHYTGPDRRKRTPVSYAGPWRRASDAEATSPTDTEVSAMTQ
ncbi:response regulator [Asticcacaulis excentricus]|uniref:response regulator n=1 Tax=Asticcacaulis excentricus TaxID=78587 RepID=UPI001E616F59|nr:response regulator [Asticcacaulis excentricus]